MELGEMLETIGRRIEEAAEEEFRKSGLPVTMQPFVMQNVAGRFYEKAYRHKIENGQEIQRPAAK